MELYDRPQLISKRESQVATVARLKAETEVVIRTDSFDRLPYD
jgi:hypothetical protein